MAGVSHLTQGAAFSDSPAPNGMYANFSPAAGLSCRYLSGLKSRAAFQESLSLWLTVGDTHT